MHVEGGTLNLNNNTIAAGSLFFRGATSAISNVAAGGATLNSTTGPLLTVQDKTVTFAVNLSGGPTASASGDIHYENTMNTGTGATIAGALNLGGVNRVVNVDDSVAAPTDLTIAGTITGGGASGGLTKKGTGTLAVAGTQSYTGATNVNEGTLVVSGSLSGTSGANVTGGVNPAILKIATNATLTAPTVVGNNGTLSGTGTVNGNVNVNSGGSLAPGVDTLAPNGLQINGSTLSFASGSQFVLSLSNSQSGVNGQPQPGDYSKLTLGTGVNTTLGGSILVNVNGTLNQLDLFTVISNGTNAAIGTHFSNTSPVANSTRSFASGSTVCEINYQFNAGAWATAGGGQAGFEAALGGRDVALLVVPEPNAMAMLAGGLGLALGLQRFRRRRTA